MKVKYRVSLGADLAAGKLYDGIRERSCCLINDRGEEQTYYQTRFEPGKPFFRGTVLLIDQALGRADEGGWWYSYGLPMLNHRSSLGSIPGKRHIQPEIDRLHARRPSVHSVLWAHVHEARLILEEPEASSAHGPYHG